MAKNLVELILEYADRQTKDDDVLYFHFVALTMGAYKALTNHREENDVSDVSNMTTNGRIFTETERCQMGRKVNVRGAPTVDNLSPFRVEELLERGARVHQFDGTNADLDRCAADAMAEEMIEFFAYDNVRGNGYAVNGEGYDYARYIGRLDGIAAQVLDAWPRSRRL